MTLNALELKIPPVALALLFAAAMWTTSVLLPDAAFAVPLRLPLAAMFAASGVAFAIAGVIAFRRMRTTVNPTKPGDTSALVVSGVYRISRNPMYVGFLLILLAWAVQLSHAVAFLFLPAFVAYMNRFQILPEERVLGTKFGDEFAAYMRSVRRWI